jgi:beta-aspartyl-peptidase (threonine type)
MQKVTRTAVAVLLLGAAWVCVPSQEGRAGLGDCRRGRVVVWPAPAPWVVVEAAPVVVAPAESAEAAIRRVLDAQVEAWNKGDLEAFMTGYWKSPELTFFSGAEPQRGWQATIERYRKRYQSEGQEMGKLTFSELDIQVLGPDSALVRGRWQLVRSKDKPGGLFTLIFKRFPEGWRIVHDHTSGS